MSWLLDRVWPFLLALHQYTRELGVCWKLVERMAHRPDFTGRDDISVRLCLYMDVWRT